MRGPVAVGPVSRPAAAHAAPDGGPLVAPHGSLGSSKCEQQFIHLEKASTVPSSPILGPDRREGRSADAMLPSR